MRIGTGTIGGWRVLWWWDIERNDTYSNWLTKTSGRAGEFKLYVIILSILSVWIGATSGMLRRPRSINLAGTWWVVQKIDPKLIHTHDERLTRIDKIWTIFFRYGAYPTSLSFQGKISVWTFPFGWKCDTCGEQLKIPEFSSGTFFYARSRPTACWSVS